MTMTFKLLAVIAALNLSGCMILNGRGYHNDRGDLVGTDDAGIGVRYVGWCKLHPHTRDCAPAPIAVADADVIDHSD
jgi:hypothetical protein